MNIYQYFTNILDIPPTDGTLQDLPLDSKCGADCARAIDAARAFQAVTDQSVHGLIIQAADEAVQTFWRG